MKRLMKAELYKFGHEKSVWIISTVLIACACISIFTQVYASAENAFTNLGKDVMVLYLACAIYAGVSFADEFTNRTIIHIIAHGYSRMQFLMAKLIHYLLGCLLIILAYLPISTGIAAAVLGTSTPASVFIGHILCNILRGLPFYFVMTMVFFFFVIVTRKGALAIAGSVSSAILFVVFTNKAYSAQAFPEQSWLRLLPNIQLSMLYDGSLIFTDYLIAVALSVISSITIFTVCIAIIRKTEL